MSADFLKKPYPLFGRILIAAAIGLAVGYLRVQLAFLVQNGAGDYYYSMGLVRDLWQGRDPYDYPAMPDLVSYPMTAGLLSAPFAPFTDEIAGGLFLGFSSALLTWFLLGGGKSWPLFILLSWPFTYAILFVQYSPLIACIWFAPALLRLILVKPQSALPLVFSNRLSRKGLVLGVLLLAASMILSPGWPIAWWRSLGPYTGSIPVFSLPLGPLVLLALTKYKDRRARMLVLMAFMP